MACNHSPKKQEAAPLEGHLLRLTALFSEREASLVMLLEESRQRVWQRPEWLLKECEYQEKDSCRSREVRRIVMHWVLLNEGERGVDKGEEYCITVKQFWLKIKILIKTSLDRTKVLGLLSEALFQRYESIIVEINCGYDQSLGITHYRYVEELIKLRNRLIHQILSQQKTVPLNDSKYPLGQLRQSSKEMRSSKLLSLTKRKDNSGLDWRLLRRPLSHHSKQKRPLCSREMLRPKKMKKMNSTLGHLEQQVYNIMEMRIEAPIDRKKGVKANLEALYHQLLSKNQNNQRQITKFVLSHSGKKIMRFRPKQLVKLVPRDKLKVEAAADRIQPARAVKSRSIFKNKLTVLGTLGQLRRQLKLVDHCEKMKPYKPRVRKGKKCL